MKSAGGRRIGAGVALFACLALLLGGGYLWLKALGSLGLQNAPVESAGSRSSDGAGIVRAPTGGDHDQIVAFCSACHAMPPPESFSKSSWRKEVEGGFDFYRQSRRTDLVVPDFEDVVAFFETRAPSELVLADAPLDGLPSPIEFRLEHQALAGPSELPAIAHLHRLRLEPEGPLSLVYCDMHSGEVGAFPLGQRDRPDVVLAKLSNPCHVEPCDLDRDGIVDLLVADLGSFTPSDHDRGRVVWLKRNPSDGSQWTTSVLLSGVGRVADVQPADFDGDGDIDLVVAEFGWRTTGRILLLRNTGGPAESPPKFEVEVVDSRHGTIHVPVVDLNGDGHLDFVALISQEHEVIEAFLNKGDGTFRRETIYDARNPGFGSTGIQLVDLDGDGDIDVLYTNGDLMDSNLIKPYHGVQWLENTGSYPFACHRLADVPGVMRALAEDLDSDGILDIAVAAYLPDHILAKHSDRQFDSLIWLKQERPGVFTRHRIERGNLQHMALELADADGDGRIDVLTGNFGASLERFGPRMTLWLNPGKSRPSSQEGHY